MADVEVDPQGNDPEELVKLGIKAYMMRDYNAAVTAFSRAIEITATKHGDNHDSLGSVYLYYGKTLLEISREETEALGDAVTRDLNSDSDEEDASAAEPTTNEQAKAEMSVDEGTDDSKPEETPKSDSKANGSGGNAEGDAKAPEEANGSVDNAKNGEAKADSSGDQPSGSGTTAETKSGEEGESTEEKPDEEPTDLQLAWEVLELAKLIFEKRAETGRKQLAETLVALGEVSLESENFENAIVDIKQGLEIQKSLFKSDSRNLAETYYKLAIALSTNNQIEEAIENFNTSLSILNNRIAKLKENEDQEKDEIKDIEGLIPEIEEKIADMKSYKEETVNKLATALASAQTSEPKFDAGSSTSKQVSDISHLVKRKRKLDDIVEEREDNPTKKQPST